ncbi:MAG: 30S ribosomal protein S15 [Endomicrobium sp.]|jgi:small subunit ribosomal protein S15|nr:30S ribosomal protein S15 [Endomicrobium sp.]
MILKKKEIVEKFKMHVADTGSTEVQVALLTSKIRYLSEHFQKAPKDFASKVGFLKMIGQRRRLLNYIKKHNEDGYSLLIKKLDIRK